MKSLIIAFAMYSKFPMPRVDWEKKALSWALCWFPLVGLAVGAVLWLWLALAGWLGFGAVFTAALALLLPIALSGGIHLDGFCDTCDALSSHQSREAVGRLCCRLAERAERVERIFCGLPMVLKGEGPWN